MDASMPTPHRSHSTPTQGMAESDTGDSTGVAAAASESMTAEWPLSLLEEEQPAGEPPALVSRLATLRSKLRGVPAAGNEILRGKEAVEQMLLEARTREMQGLGYLREQGPETIAPLLGTSSAELSSRSRADPSAVVVTGVRTREEIDSEGRRVFAIDADANSSTAKREVETSGSTSKHSVAGLSELLDACNMQESLDTALAWCDAQGVDSISMLKEVEMEPDLIAALDLKPARAKLLSKRLAEWSMPTFMESDHAAIKRRVMA